MKALGWFLTSLFIFVYFMAEIGLMYGIIYVTEGYHWPLFLTLTLVFFYLVELCGSFMFGSWLIDKIEQKFR